MIRIQSQGNPTKPAITVATVPFPKSPISVNIPTFLPDTLRTLVKPMFWLPCVRGSSAPKMRETTKPNGIDPKRYALTTPNKYISIPSDL